MAETDNNQTANKPAAKPAKENIGLRIVKNPILISVLAMVLLSVVGLVCVSNWLGGYTNHGREIELPDLRGLSVAEADEILGLKGLTCEVIDSTYNGKGVKAGAIVEQVPKAGSKVKEGRKIYLTILAYNAKKVPLPEVRDASQRQAESALASIDISVGEIEMVPSENAGNVIEVKYRDKVIMPGTMLVVGSSVTLVVGRGQSNEEAVVPSMRGMKLEAARKLAHESVLNVGAVTYDLQVMSDAERESAIVYKQFPITGKSVPAGTRVDLFFTTDKSKLSEPEEVYKDSTATADAEENALDEFDRP